jgi:hypothetical protein
MDFGILTPVVVVLYRSTISIAEIGASDLERVNMKNPAIDGPDNQIDPGDLSGVQSRGAGKADEFLQVVRVKPRRIRTSKGLHKAIDPEFQSALAIRGIAPGLLAALDEDSTVLFADLVSQLKSETEKLKQGDMSSAKAALHGQAQVLQALFVSLVERAYTHLGSDHYQERILLALRVQNNCRKTLETLGKISNPGRPMVVQQNHVVVQGQPPGSYPVKEINPTNELLEGIGNDRLDPRAKGPTSHAHSPLETVAEGGCEDRRRQGY